MTIRRYSTRTIYGQSTTGLTLRLRRSIKIGSTLATPGTQEISVSRKLVKTIQDQPTPCDSGQQTWTWQTRRGLNHFGHFTPSCTRRATRARASILLSDIALTVRQGPTR